MKLLIHSSILIVGFALFSCATTTQREVTETPVTQINLYEKYIEDAESGDSHAQVQIGKAFEKGIDVPGDFTKAKKWYEKAASKGNAEAYYLIGRLYEMGLGVQQSREDALEWYYSSAVNSFIPAIGALIDFYEGQEEKQIQWIKEGLKAEDPYSSYRYGLIVEREDRDKAREYFLAASSSENFHAKAQLGILSLGGQFNQISEDLAVSYILESAEKGNSRSQLFAGWLYEFGDFVQKDYNNALNFYEESARKNNQMGLYNLSRFYGEGIGVTPDPVLSRDFFQQLDSEFFCPSYQDLIDYSESRRKEGQREILYRYSASRGDLEAQHQLGLRSNEEDAFQWFWVAAQEGYVPSMFELAKLYREKDPIQAALWLMMAENSGFEDDELKSRDILDELSEEEKMEVSRLFTDLFYGDSDKEADSQLLR